MNHLLGLMPSDTHSPADRSGPTFRTRQRRLSADACDPPDGLRLPAWIRILIPSAGHVPSIPPWSFANPASTRSSCTATTTTGTASTPFAPAKDSRHTRHNQPARQSSPFGVRGRFAGWLGDRKKLRSPDPRLVASAHRVGLTRFHRWPDSYSSRIQAPIEARDTRLQPTEPNLGLSSRPTCQFGRCVAPPR